MNSANFPAGGIGEGIARDRLLGAATAVIAFDGPSSVSVSRIVSRAGVSRATFYRYFRSRADCLGAARRRATIQLTEAVAHRLQGRSGAPRQEAVEALLEFASANPCEARVALLALTEWPTSAQAGQETTGGEQQDLVRHQFLRSMLAQHPHGLPLTAGVAGISALVGIRLLRREQVRSLGLGLQAWIGSYDLPPQSGAWPVEWWRDLYPPLPTLLPGPPPAFSLLPRGRSTVEPARAESVRRHRLVLAAARTVAGRGFEGLTVSDVVAAARVTRGAFYGEFSDKADVFIAAMETGLRGGISAAAAEFATGADWPDRVWRGLGALLHYLAANPELAYVGLVAADAAGERAALLNHDYRKAYTLFLREGLRTCDWSEDESELVAEAIAGAISGVLRHEVNGSRRADVRRLLPLCAYLALAPVTGAQQARSYVSARAAGDRLGRETAHAAVPASHPL